ARRHPGLLTPRGGHAAAHPGRGVGGIRGQGLGRRAGGRDRGARRRQQADALRLFRQQGGPLADGAGTRLRRQARGGARAAGGRVAAGRGDAAARGVQSAVHGGAPGVRGAAQPGEHPPGGAPQALGAGAGALLAVAGKPARGAGAGRGGRRVPPGRGPAPALRDDRGARALLRSQHAHALHHLRRRTGDRSGAAGSGESLRGGRARLSPAL
ncbi:MAG: Transcriptional regulator, AcrR family, partial [uncultured Acetobacteraceae bacterium]